jgi:hypothetical protein
VEASEVADAYAPQHFGANGNIESDDKRREQVYGAVWVGQSGDIPGERR